MDSVTTFSEGTTGLVGMEVGNLHPIVQTLGTPGINYFKPQNSSTLFALAEGYRIVDNCDYRCGQMCAPYIT